jgi:hypothetical protein
MLRVSIFMWWCLRARLVIDDKRCELSIEILAGWLAVLFVCFVFFRGWDVTLHVWVI